MSDVKYLYSNLMLGASAVHRLTRRVHELHMLDLEHLLPAMERESTRT